MDWSIRAFSHSKMNCFEMILRIEIWFVIDCLINIEKYDTILVSKNWSRNGCEKHSLHTEQLIIYFYHTLTSTEYFLIFKRNSPAVNHLWTNKWQNWMQLVWWREQTTDQSPMRKIMKTFLNPFKKYNCSIVYFLLYTII